MFVCGAAPSVHQAIVCQTNSVVVPAGNVRELGLLKRLYLLETLLLQTQDS